MRRTIFFVFFISFVVSNLFAQNWDINTLHRVNGWDNKFVRNYNKFISRSEPYVAIGVPVAMALTAWAKKDKDLLKDAVYVGTSPQGRRSYYVPFRIFYAQRSGKCESRCGMPGGK